jgi:alpha-amylase/alpha-mannosidase (GH57 family)
VLESHAADERTETGWEGARPELIVHGHFYQPPRENPWTEVVEREGSAHPYHDWNERIDRECYRPNAFARIMDNRRGGRLLIDQIVNNYSLMSFNFGPTLLSWLERSDPVTYARVLEADRLSVARRGGHGNAIAQAYNHAILPLCNDRDRRTQVRWGLADFRHRFGRDPEAMWLPETACNGTTLGTLIDEGMRFVILSPYQAERVRPLDGGEWQDVSERGVDAGVPYRYFHPDGSRRSIAVFFYDAAVARAIAFEGALASSQGLVDRFAAAAAGGAKVVHVATDGESYGHHHGFGERCLAYALEREAPARGFHVTNYGELLDRHGPTMEVSIKPGPNGEGTAWSCSHGVGRWLRHCGCRAGGPEGWSQHWRRPLREAFDLLRDEAARQFEARAGELLKDPWAARDAYIQLVLDRRRHPDDLLRRFARRPLDAREQSRLLGLLEMQRSCLLMYTSCGWYFSELSGIECVQVMKYAARAMDFMDELGVEAPHRHFLDVLSEARSNIPEMGNGADVFRRLVEPSRASPERVASHLAICSLVGDRDDAGDAPSFSFYRQSVRQESKGRLTLATGRLVLRRVATGDAYDFAYAAMHFGGTDFYCLLKAFPGLPRFRRAEERLWMAARSGKLPALMGAAQDELGPDEFGLDHLLPDGRQRISSMAFDAIVGRLSETCVRTYDENERTIDMLLRAGFDLPRELRVAAELALGRRLEAELAAQRGSHDPAAYLKAVEISEDVARHGYAVDRGGANRIFGDILGGAVREALEDATDENIGAAAALVGLRDRLRLEVSLDPAQELLYETLEGDESAGRGRFAELGDALGLSSRLWEPFAGTGPGVGIGAEAGWAAGAAASARAAAPEEGEGVDVLGGELGGGVPAVHE